MTLDLRFLRLWRTFRHREERSPGPEQNQCVDNSPAKRISNQNHDSGWSRIFLILLQNVFLANFPATYYFILRNFLVLFNLSTKAPCLTQSGIISHFKCDTFSEPSDIFLLTVGTHAIVQNILKQRKSSFFRYRFDLHHLRATCTLMLPPAPPPAPCLYLSTPLSPRALISPSLISSAESQQKKQLSSVSFILALFVPL